MFFKKMKIIILGVVQIYMRIAHFGTDTITNLEPKSRKLVLDEIKNA